MRGPYAEFGPKLVERGYAALPVMPGTKRPGERRNGTWVGMFDWQQRYSQRLPTEFETCHWSSAEDAGLCVVTGAASGDLIGIDIDTDDPAIKAAIRAVLPPTPAIKVGQKGETLFYRGPGVPSRSYNQYDATGARLCRLVDLIGPGRQTVLPPTIHPDTGQPYRWVGERALVDLDPGELPELPADIGDRIGEALKPFGYRPEPAKPHLSLVGGTDGDTPHRELNNAALASLDAWVPRLGLYKLRPRRGGYVAVATWRPSHSGRPLEQRNPNLKIMSNGIRDFHDDRTYTPLDLVMAACGCDIDTAFVALSHLLGRDVPIRVELKPSADRAARDLRDAPDAPASPKADVFDRLLQERGLIGEAARWMLTITRRPQPRLAVAASLSLVATLASRQMLSPTYSNLNLYMLMIAETANGKDAGLKGVKSILRSAKLADLIGPPDPPSDVGLYDTVDRHPVVLAVQDEFGDYLTSASSQRASPHQLKVMAAMRVLWDGGPISTSHAISRPSVQLFNPCLSMLCASTPDQFYSAIGSAQMKNGFINRFLVAAVDCDATKQKAANAADVPPSIVEKVLALANRPGGLAAARFRMGPARDDRGEAPFVVPWRDTAAEAAWEQYEERNLARMRTSPAYRDLAPRAAQNAVKIATLLALSENTATPSIATGHVAMAVDFVEASVLGMMKGIADHTPENAAAVMADKVVSRLALSEQGVTHRELFRALRRGFRDHGDFQKMMASLVQSGEVIEEIVMPKHGGHAHKIYRTAA